MGLETPLPPTPPPSFGELVPNPPTTRLSLQAWLWFFRAIGNVHRNTPLGDAEGVQLTPAMNHGPRHRPCHTDIHMGHTHDMPAHARPPPTKMHK